MNAIIGNAAVGRNNTQTTKDETKRDKGHKKTRLRSSRMADNSTLMVAPPPLCTPFAHPLHTLAMGPDRDHQAPDKPQLDQKLNCLVLMSVGRRKTPTPRHDTKSGNTKQRLMGTGNVPNLDRWGLLCTPGGECRKKQVQQDAKEQIR